MLISGKSNTINYNPNMKLVDYEKEIIIKCLDHHNGSIYKTCIGLGIARETLYRKMKKYKITRTVKTF